MAQDTKKIIAREEQQLSKLVKEVSKTNRLDLLEKIKSLRELWLKCKEAGKGKTAELNFLVEKYAEDFISLKREADSARSKAQMKRGLSPSEKIIFSLIRREWLPFKSLLCEGKLEAAKKWIMSVVNFYLKESKKEAERRGKEVEAIARKACDMIVGLANEQKHRVKDGFLKKIFGRRSDEEKTAELIKRDFITPAQLAGLVADDVEAMLRQPLPPPSALEKAEKEEAAEGESVISPTKRGGDQSSTPEESLNGGSGEENKKDDPDDWGDDEQEPWEQGKEGIAG